MSARKTVVLTTSARVMTLLGKDGLMFLRDCAVWAAIALGDGPGGGGRWGLAGDG